MIKQNSGSFRLTIFILVSLLLTLYGESKSDRVGLWKQWHGPNRNNISIEKGFLKKWPDKGPELIWTASGCGKGYSSVAISEDTIYTAGTLKKQTYILAFDLKGNLKWKTANGKRWKVPLMMVWARNYGGSRSTPTVNDGFVYHLSELGRLAAFDAKTGSPIWAINILEKFDAELPMYGYAESVMIDGDNVICYPGGEKGYIIALNKKTGKQVWVNKQIGDNAGYCSPILVEDHGVRQIITMSALAVLGVNADTGELLWRIEHRNKRKLNISTPVYKDGYVNASCGYGGGSIGIKLKYKGKEVTAEKVWDHKYFDNHHGGILLLDGYLYGTGHNKKGWYCLDFKTGKEMYREAKGGKGSFMYADGMFYYLDEKGTMRLVKPSTKRFEVVSEFKVPESGKDKYWSHPVAFKGRLYIRHADKLYVYNIQP